jgi:hypothetical protein
VIERSYRDKFKEAALVYVGARILTLIIALNSIFFFFPLAALIVFLGYLVYSRHVKTTAVLIHLSGLWFLWYALNMLPASVNIVVNYSGTSHNLELISGFGGWQVLSKTFLAGVSCYMLTRALFDLSP